MAPERRTELVAVRLTPEEVAMLKELADADGVYQSDVLRRLVRDAHRLRFEGKPSTKKKRPK